MLSLLLATVASAGNALTMKFASTRSDNRWALLLFNYFTATALSALSATRAGLVIPSVAPQVWALGIVTGVLFITTFALLQLNVRVNGATVSSSLARMGAVIPMLLSIVLFGEYPTLAGAAGIVVAIVATALLSIPQPDAEKGNPSAHSTRGLLVPMVLAGGIADTMPKVFEGTGDPAHEEA